MLRVKPSLFHDICSAFGLLILLVQNVALADITLIMALGDLCVCVCINNNHGSGAQFGNE